MTTYLMLDDVNLTLLERYASEAHACAGYVNGGYANWNELVAKYPSGKVLISIDTRNDPSAGAQCLDIETGDAVVSDAPSWFRKTQRAGKKANDLRYYPKLYTSEGNLVALVDAMTKAGVKRDAYMIWSAHYTNEPHICGPKSCGSKVQADATQWTDAYKGVSLDASLCYGYFFAGPPKPSATAPVAPAKPKPAPKPTRRVVAKDSKATLAELADDAQTTVGDVAAQSFEHLSRSNLQKFVMFLAEHGRDGVPPAGFVYWTV